MKIFTKIKNYFIRKRISHAAKVLRHYQIHHKHTLAD